MSEESESDEEKGEGNGECEEVHVGNWASLRDHRDVVARLIEKGGDVNAKAEVIASLWRRPLLRVEIVQCGSHGTVCAAYTGRPRASRPS